MASSCGVTSPVTQVVPGARPRGAACPAGSVGEQRSSGEPGRGRGTGSGPRRRPGSARPGVPAATTRPASITTTVSASCSASSRKCVVSTTLTPSARSRRISSQVARRACGSMPGGRLVQEHQLGTADQRQRERQPLLLAAGQPLDRGAGDVGQPDQLEQLARIVRVRGVGGEQPQQLDRRAPRGSRRRRPAA